MGLRVNKCIGYGLSDFVPTEEFLTRQKTEPLVGDFHLWCEINQEEIIRRFPVSLSRQFIFKNFFWSCKQQSNVLLKPLADSVQCNFECKAPFKAVFIPPHKVDQWFRLNDDIDYLEEVSKGLDGRFVRLDRGIYPYEKGEPPLILAALLTYYGVADVWDKLEEAMYVYWV